MNNIDNLLANKKSTIDVILQQLSKTANNLIGQKNKKIQYLAHKVEEMEAHCGANEQNTIVFYRKYLALLKKMNCLGRMAMLLLRKVSANSKMENTINVLERERVATGDKAKSLERENIGYSQKISELESEGERYRERISTLEKGRYELDDKIYTLERDNSRHLKRIEELEAKNTDYERQLRELKHSGASADNSMLNTREIEAIKLMATQLEDRERTIVDLKNMVNSLNNENSNLNSRLEKQNNEMLEKSAALQEAKNSIYELQSVKKTQYETIANLNKDLEYKNTKITELQNEFKDLVYEFNNLMKEL